MAAEAPVGKLSASEMDQLRTVLGNTASPLITAVARLFLAHPDGGGWQDANAWGVVVLVIDRLRNAKIIRLYDLQSFRVLFDEELYVGMNYVAAKPYFHTFEVDRGIVGFDFCDEDEARTFYSRVVSMIPRPEHIQQQEQERTSAESSERPKNSGFLGQFKRALGFKKTSTPVLAIGRPTNVVHKQHIGFNADGDFDVQNIPDEWKVIFKGAGVKPSHLKDRETAMLMMNTIRQTVPNRPSLSAAVPPLPPANVAPPPRPPPGHGAYPHRPNEPLQSAPPSRAPRPRRGPMPPPGPSQPPQPQPQQQLQQPHYGISQHPMLSTTSAPAPPVRAPSQGLDVHPAPPQPSKSTPGPPPPPPPPPVPPPVAAYPTKPPVSMPSGAPPISGGPGPGRVGLLSEIRNFDGSSLVTYNKEEDEGLPDLKEMDDGNKVDLMWRIKSVMEARRGVLQQVGNDDDDDDDDDDWD